MKKTAFSLLILIVISIATCGGAFSQENNTTVTVNPKTEQLVQSSNQFGLELFKEVAKTNGELNFMISPLSVTLAMAMTYNGAEGNTKTAFDKTFHFNDFSTNRINKSLSDLCTTLKETDPQVTFNLANSIWYKNSLNIDRNFLKINKRYYDAETLALDFNSPSSVKMINYWVNEKTNGKIPSIINRIDPQDLMILINATYFKGKWKYQFNPLSTSKEPFTLQNGKTIQVPTMMQKSIMGYLSNNLLTAVELPYGNGDFSMVLMLPNKGKTVQDIENAMNEKTWKQWNTDLNKEKVFYIHLPKFKFEFEKTLNAPLSKLGLGIAFSGSANFSKISPNVPMHLSVVKQKTFLEVNEEGTEAAAATTVIMRATAVREGSIFFNRPFLFAIKENRTNTILFIGCVMDPSQN